MAKYRALQTTFWDDAFVVELTPEEKYFFLYLLTNNKSKQCGCYELPYKVIEMQTGYNRETVEKLLSRFEEYGKIKYDRDTKELLILNWHRHNYTSSVKVEKCIVKEVSEVKSEEFRGILIDICLKHGYNVDSIPYTYPIDTVSIDYGEKEKEKEKQKEKQQQKQKTDDVTIHNLLRKSFPEMRESDLNSVVDELNKQNQGIEYLKEKIELVKNTDNVKSVVGYLIKAINNNYKLFKKKNGFNNFDSTIDKYSENELNEIIKNNQERKYGGA